MATDPAATLDRLAADLADTFGGHPYSHRVALASALRSEAPALQRFGVCVRVPRWRRWVQRRLTPRRYQRWMLAQVQAQTEQVTAPWPTPPTIDTAQGPW